MWRASLFTLFPGMFPGPLGTSLAGDALARGIWSYEALDMRAHGLGRHRAVDDTPAGGGAGMVLRADVVAASLDAHLAADDPRPRLLMSPRGVPLTQQRVRHLAEGPGVVLVCGRFEGVDERVIAARGLVEVSIGDYVLSGGEIAALVLLDACIRLLPGVMGASDSGRDESFEGGLLEYPHYTRPREFEGATIPPVLLGGNHAAIAVWRREEALRLTRARRPDLLARTRPSGDRDMTNAPGERPPFAETFAIDEVGDTWIAVRDTAEGHWWRFVVDDKNGRLQLVHDEHREAEDAAHPIAARAIDAYDTATLEARRRGMVD